MNLSLSSILKKSFAVIFSALLCMSAFSFISCSSESEDSSTGTVTVSVNASASSIDYNGTATLTATAVSSTGASISSYSWKITSGSSYAAVSGSSATATLTGKNSSSSSTRKVTVTCTAKDSNGVTGKYSVTVTVGKKPASAVTLSINAGSSSIASDGTATLTATASTSVSGGSISSYAWSISEGSDYASLSAASEESVTLTGANTSSSAQTVTVKCIATDSSGETAEETVEITVKAASSSEDAVFIQDGSTISDTDTKTRSDTLTISFKDVPTGYAGVSYTAGTYTTKTVTTRDDLITYAKKGNYFIIVDGMIDMSDGLLPSAGGGTTDELDAFVKENTSSAYLTYEDYVKAYAAACSTSTDDKKTSGDSISSLNSTLWTLSNAYKKVIQLSIKDNTIIVGKDSSSGIKGGTISISGVKNVVLRNLKIQDAYDPFPHHENGDGYNAQWDGITIQGSCQNIWIDHCTIEDTMTLSHVMTGGTSGTKEKWQTYDGLLDIKGDGKYITVSYCKFKNHDKTSLIGSSDGEGASSTRMVTYHHNYFYNCGQRLPMVRNTTMHLYNNYYDYSSGNYTQQYAVGVRNGSIIYSENNYFGSSIKYAFKADSKSKGTLYSSGDDGTVNYDEVITSSGTTLFSSAVNAYTYTADSISTITDSSNGVPYLAGTGTVTIN